MKKFKFTGELLKETERAYLINDGTGETWYPKSQVKKTTKCGGANVGKYYEFECPQWLAEKKGIIK